MIVGVCRLIANHLHLTFFESIPEVRVLPSTGITRLQRSYYPVRLPPMPPPEATLRPLPSHQTGLPRLPEPPFQRAVPTTPADRAGGIRIVTFEACGAVAWAMRRRSVSHPRSSNRTCGFPASGSPTGFVMRHTKQITDRKRHLCGVLS